MTAAISSEDHNSVFYMAKHKNLPSVFESKKLDDDETFKKPKDLSEKRNSIQNKLPVR